MTSNFQISGKAADGRIYVIGGENFAEFCANLQDIYGPGADRVIEDFNFLLDPSIAEAAATAAGLRTAAPAPSPAPSAGAPSAPGAPECAHGARVFRTGTGAKGQWQAWFCPTPKGTPNQCAAQWA